MTLEQLTERLNLRLSSAGERLHFTGDYAGTFGISNEEALRIAVESVNLETFMMIWEHEDWWTDANNLNPRV